MTEPEYIEEYRMASRASDFLSLPVQNKSNITQRRQAEIKPFIDRMPEMEKSYVCFLLSHVPTDDLHAFWVQCSKARNFYAFFQWALKVKK